MKYDNSPFSFLSFVMIASGVSYHRKEKKDKGKDRRVFFSSKREGILFRGKHERKPRRGGYPVLPPEGKESSLFGESSQFFWRGEWKERPFKRGVQSQR